MTKLISPTPRQQFIDENGDPLTGGLLYTYYAGTTTPATTFTDATGSTANTNPVVLNSRGEAAVWLSAFAYKYVLKSSTGTTIWTQDNITGVVDDDTEQTERESIVIAAGDETTAITAGTAKVTFRMPYEMSVTEVRASLTTAQTSGSVFTVDVNLEGTSILSTKLTLANGITTSTATPIPPVLSTTTLPNDGKITIDVDQAGTSPTGLKVILNGYRGSTVGSGAVPANPTVVAILLARQPVNRRTRGQRRRKAQFRTALWY